MGLSDKQDAVTSMLGVYVEAYLAHGDGYGDGDGDSDYMSEAADSEYDDGFYADGFGGVADDAVDTYVVGHCFAGVIADEHLDHNNSLI